MEGIGSIIFVVIALFFASFMNIFKKIYDDKQKKGEEVNENSLFYKLVMAFTKNSKFENKGANQKYKSLQIDTLGKAIKKKDIDKVFNMFIENPVLDINKVYNTGETPLMLAIKTKDQTVVKIVLDKGAKIDIKDFSGNTPLSLAEKSGQPEILALLKNILKRRKAQTELFEEYD